MRLRAVCLGLLAGGVSLTGAALASKDASIEVAEPQPGGRLSGESQGIASSMGVTMTTTGDLRDTTVVLEGGVKVSKNSANRGAAVAACWLGGPGAIKVKDETVQDWLRTDPDIQQLTEVFSSPRDALEWCMYLVKFVAERIPEETSGRAAAGCRAAPVNLRFRRRNGRLAVSPAKPRQGPNTRYTCKKVAGGIALTARDRRGRPLKGAIGSKLGYGLYKSTKGPPSDGKLKLRFQLR